MLKRYLIANGISTAVLYGGVYAVVMSAPSLTQAASDAWETYVMGHTFLGPVLHRMITVAAGL